MNIREAALVLDRIRNDRSGEAERLLIEVDAVGAWLASQKSSKSVMKLLSEAHEARELVVGGRCGGRVRFVSE